MGCSGSKHQSLEVEGAARTDPPAPEAVPVSKLERQQERQQEKQQEPSFRQQEPSFAYVVADFVSEHPGELSVKGGDFVELVDNQAEPPPTGWCRCRGRSYERSAADEAVGLVPWYFLISAAHALLAAETADADLNPDADVDDVAEAPAAGAHVQLLQLRVVRGEGGAFGIDFDEENVVRRQP